MATQNPPFALQNASHSAALFRQALASLKGARLPATYTNGAWPTGVVGAGDLAVSANGTPNMSVNVAAGQAWIAGSTAANQGLYYCFNDAPVNLIIAAADPTNPRYDLVVATVLDAAYAGASNEWVLQVITGTAAPSPVAPSLPANSLALALVSVPAAASSITSGDIGFPNSLIAFAPPAYSAPLTGSVSVPAGTSAVLAPGTPSIDTVSGNDTVDKGYRVPAGCDGYWNISAHVSAYESNAGQWNVTVLLNGVATYVACATEAGSSSYRSSAGVNFVSHLNAGDILTVQVTNNSATNGLETDSNAYASCLSLHRIG